jgi:hypothetical protein
MDDKERETHLDSAYMDLLQRATDVYNMLREYGYQPSASTIADMIALVRRLERVNAALREGIGILEKERDGLAFLYDRALGRKQELEADVLRLSEGE